MQVAGDVRQCVVGRGDTVTVAIVVKHHEVQRRHPRVLRASVGVVPRRFGFAKDGVNPVDAGGAEREGFFKLDLVNVRDHPFPLVGAGEADLPRGLARDTEQMLGRLIGDGIMDFVGHCDNPIIKLSSQVAIGKTEFVVPRDVTSTKTVFRTNAILVTVFVG